MGISTTVADARFAKPLDKEMVNQLTGQIAGGVNGWPIRTGLQERPVNRNPTASNQG